MLALKNYGIRMEITPLKTTTHSLILDFAYAHRAGWNVQIGSVWLPWKMFVYAVLFWAKKGSEITLWTVTVLRFHWQLSGPDTVPRIIEQCGRKDVDYKLL